MKRFKWVHSTRVQDITKTCLFKYTENFTIKNEDFQIKYSYIFHISAQIIDSGYSLARPRRSGSNVYPQSMFLSRNKKNHVYPCKPQFCYKKVGFKGVNIICMYSWRKFSTFLVSRKGNVYILRGAALSKSCCLSSEKDSTVKGKKWSKFFPCRVDIFSDPFKKGFGFGVQ